MNKLCEVDETSTNTEAKYATYDNQEVMINETKNKPTVKMYDAKGETKFLIESTVDFKSRLLFNALKYNTCADFNNEHNVGSPTTSFSANSSHNFGVGISYMINNSTFYDENSFYDSKKYVEVGVYATKVQESPNDDSISSQKDLTMFEYGTSCNENTDEEDLPPLTYELKKDSGGYLINNKVYLTEFQWNTMVYDSNNDTIYCALCDKLITIPDMCDDHMSSVRHKLNLNKHKPLNKFPDNIIRLIRKQYHCGFCNKLFDKEDKDDHLSSRVHDISTEFARNKVTDKIQIKKVHKIGKYTFKMEENEITEIESDVYFDEERERQSNCDGSVTTVSDGDNRTIVNDSVNLDASVNDNSVGVVMGADIDTAGRDIVVASNCGESDSGHGITSSGNDIVSNGSDVESNENDFARIGDDNIAMRDPDVVINGTSDVPNSGTNVTKIDNDIAISNNDVSSSDSNVAKSDNDVPDSDVANSDSALAVNSNDITKNDSGIASSGNVVGSNKVKKSDQSHDIARNYKDIADKISDKSIADKSSDKNIANKSSDKHIAGKNSVQTVGQTVISEENKSCKIKSNRKFVVTKPKNFVQDFLMIEYKDKKIGLHFHSWHMLIKNSMGSLYCAICKLILPPKEVNSHCEKNKHLKKLMSITVLQEFSEYFIRRFDSNFYHCSHCNTMIDQHKMRSHLLTAHSKSGKKLMEDEHKNNDTIKNAGNTHDEHKNNDTIKNAGNTHDEHKNNDTIKNAGNTDDEHKNNDTIKNAGNTDDEHKNNDTIKNAGNTDDQQNTDLNDHHLEVKDSGRKRERKKNLFTLLTEHENDSETDKNINSENPPNDNVNDLNHRAYLASHRQAWSPGLRYEQIVGDIMVYKFGFLFQLKYLAYNVICRSRNTYFCGLCDQTVADEVALYSHVLSPYHRYCVESTPYVVEFGLHLIRHIRGLFHCTLCNVPVNTYAVFNHTTSELHVLHLAAALGIPAERTVPPATSTTPCILPTGIPSRPLLPIPRVSFIHLNGVIDSTLIQNPGTASCAKSAAGVASDCGPHSAFQTPFVPPNSERNFNSFNPALSFNVEANIASVKNDLHPNASMPQSRADNVPNNAADTAVDHLAKIVLDAHRNCDPAQNETRSQQSFIINDPLSQFNKKDGPENTFQGPVSQESQNVNTVKCENPAQDILNYTQNSSAGQDTGLTKHNLILSETKPQIKIDVGAHDAIGSEDFEIQNINDTIAYEKLELDLLDQIKDCDIAQDSKSVESSL